MKKCYQKPIIVCERFQLSQSIAACYYKLNATLEESCMTVENGNNVDAGGFISETACEYEIQDFCITNGVNDRTTFMS